MREPIARPLSKAEMEAIRRAARDEEGIRADFRALFLAVGRRLPFARDLLAAYRCATDPATPARVKLILLAALAYFVAPIDLVPDVLPLLGFTDDAAVLAAAIAAVRSAMTPAHSAWAERVLAGREPVGW